MWELTSFQNEAVVSGTKHTYPELGTMTGAALASWNTLQSGNVIDVPAQLRPV